MVSRFSTLLLQQNVVGTTNGQRVTELWSGHKPRNNAAVTKAGPSTLGLWLPNVSCRLTLVSDGSQSINQS